MIRHRRLLAAAVAAMVVAAACSSTTRLEAGGGTAGGGAGGSSSAGESPGAAGVPDGSGFAGGGTDGVEPGGATVPGDGDASSGVSAASGGAGEMAPGASTAGPAGSGDVGSAVAKPPAGPGAQGVTDDTITIGIRHYDREGLQAFTAAYGIEGEVPDPRAYAEAVLADVNRRGGMAGRRVEPVWDAVDATQSATQVETTNQQSCSAFTEDATVFAVASSLPGNVGSFSRCLAAANTVHVADPLSYVDAEMLEQLRGFFYLPGTSSSTRFARFWIDGLAHQGFFANGSKLGVLWYADDEGIYQRTLEQGVKPALAAHGRAVEEEFSLSSYTDSQQYASAVLRMRQAGITHVLILDVSSLVSFFFMTQAETQGYRPAYGLSSGSAFVFLETNAPKGQLAKVSGVGWLPAWDTTGSRTPPPSPSEQACLDVIVASGARVEGAFARGLAYWTCDTIGFLQAALARAPSVSPTGLLTGVESLGDQYQAPGTFRARFGPGRGDGAAAARDIAYDTGCACFTYRSDSYDVG